VALQQDRNRLSLKDSERPLFGHDVMEHTIGCSTVQDEGGRVRAGVPLRSELLDRGIFAVHVRRKVTRIRKGVQDPSAFYSVLERQRSSLNAAKRARQFRRT
jgi:hypothetical protein